MTGEHVLPAITGEVESVARQIVDAGMKVHSRLGPGLLESAYEHCLAFELDRRGLQVARQVPLSISYDDLTLDVGYRIDLLVCQAVIVEVKAVDALSSLHQAQLLTYLKLSHCRLGLLMNFNVRLLRDGLKRMVR